MMALDRSLSVGKLTLAAIVNRSLGYNGGPGVSFQATKTPLVILVYQGDGTMIFELDGSPISRENAETRFPGLVSAFERSLPGHN